MAKETLEVKLAWLYNQLNGAVSFIILSIFFVILRCVGVGLVNWKQRRVKPIIWEDALLLASLFTFIPLCVCAIVNAQAYINYYSTANRTAQRHHLILLFKSTYAFSVVYPIACVLPKLSICSMYLALFKVQMRLRRITYVACAFLIANAIAWLIPSIMICTPISGYWNYTPHQTTCLNYNIMGTWISLPHIVSDLIILSLPVPYLWNMQLQPAKKAGLMFTFLVASVGIISGALRLALYIHRTYIDKPGTAQTTKSITLDTITSYTEPGTYLVAACLPRLAALVHELHTSIHSLLDSLRARRQSYKSVIVTSDDGSPRRRSASAEQQVPSGRVNVKLTNTGKLETLVSDLERMGERM